MKNQVRGFTIEEMKDIRRLIRAFLLGPCKYVEGTVNTLHLETDRGPLVLLEFDPLGMLRIYPKSIYVALEVISVACGDFLYQIAYGSYQWVLKGVNGIIVEQGSNFYTK